MRSKIALLFAFFCAASFSAAHAEELSITMFHLEMTREDVSSILKNNGFTLWQDSSYAYDVRCDGELLKKIGIETYSTGREKGNEPKNDEQYCTWHFVFLNGKLIQAITNYRDTYSSKISNKDFMIEAAKKFNGKVYMTRGKTFEQVPLEVVNRDGFGYNAFCKGEYNEFYVEISCIKDIIYSVKNYRTLLYGLAVQAAFEDAMQYEAKRNSDMKNLKF